MGRNPKKKDDKKKNKEKGKHKKVLTEKTKEKTEAVSIDSPTELLTKDMLNQKFVTLDHKYLFEDPKNVLTINSLASASLFSESGIYLSGEPAGISRGGLHGDFVEISGVTTSTTLNKQIDLQNEITRLKRELGNKIEELDEAKEDKEKKEAKIKKLERKQKKLLKKENLMHLLGRVNEKAREKLFDSEDFVNLFNMNDICKVVVMSIDIRRSTELMLKAKDPKLYAEFITSLCKKLTNIIISNFGVFDKFTGDGILGFFPYFYSGQDATFYALKSADECHKVFNEHYKENRHCFSTILEEVSLCIGIDFGDAYLTNINNELTVVGNPVVYACRFSGGEHGKTFLNQHAYEEVKSKYQDRCQLSETKINLKHEGHVLAYEVNSINYVALDIDPPDWDRLIKENNKE